MMKIIFFILTIFCISTSYAESPKREMRGVWIATVANIDWPKSPNMNEARQKEEMIAILDRVVDYNMNCVVFQIRPTADALYQSSFEPWSHWLTGTQGTKPTYDPLQFVIEECDKRGIAVHVWINPYRVWLDKDNIQNATSQIHPYLKYKEWLITYGKTVYLNQALENTRQYVCKVVADIVRNYDIDAIHMDDYFYPYRIANQEFPDHTEYKNNPRGFSNKDDWRRDNVNLTVKNIHDTIKNIKPWVEFGISPFGVWRNKSKDPRGSDTQGGQTNYDDLYADILTWCKEGWVDYIVPQIYWHIGFKIADYKILANWWNENSNGVPTYIGHGSYRIDPKSKTKEWQTPYEIVRQVSLNRELENISGSIMYSANSLINNKFKDAITEKHFSNIALMPENPTIESITPEPPGAPSISYNNGKAVFSWTPELDDRRFVLYKFPRSGNHDFNDPKNIIAVMGGREFISTITKENVEKHLFAVSALSLTNKESDPVFF